MKILQPIVCRLALAAAAVLAPAWTHAAASAWTYIEDTDDFDGTTTAIARSPNTPGMPHRGSTVIVRCTDGTALEAYLTFGFLNRAADGPIAVKVGDAPPTQVRVGESQSRTALFLRPGSLPQMVGFLVGLADADTLAVRFVYYKEGRTTIKYDMTGSHTAIRQVLAACDATARTERIAAKAAEDLALRVKASLLPVYEADDTPRERMEREVTTAWKNEAGRASASSDDESLSMRCAVGVNTLTWRSGMFPRRRGAASGVVRLAVDGHEKAYPAHLLRLATGLEVEIRMGRNEEVANAMRVGSRVELSIDLPDRTATAGFSLNGAGTAIAQCLGTGRHER